MKQQLLIMMLSAVSTMAAWGDNITFADANVKALCVANWDTDSDGELSYEEAAAVTSLGTVFKSNSDITSFDELQYFTGLTSIGRAAFNLCENLSSITLPNSVTTIESWAFAACSGLNSISIPNSVTTIGFKAFMNCTNLSSVCISDLAAWCAIPFKDDDDHDFSETNPLKYAHHLILNGEEVTELVIPDGVSTIGNYSFQNCTGLTSVTLPTSITSIGKCAFEDCKNLSSVNITDLEAWCNINFGSQSANPLTKAHYLYLNGERIDDLVIPNSVERILSHAFSCGWFSSVTIPSTTRLVLGTGQFRGAQIGEMTLTQSVNSSYTFYYATINRLVIAPSVTYIGDLAFYGSNIGELEIPYSEKVLEWESGRNSDGLFEWATIGAAIVDRLVKASFDGSSIESTFNSTPITKLSIGPNGLSSSLCSGCRITDLFFDGVTEISNYALSTNSSNNNTITNIHLPQGLTSIGSNAFMGCTFTTVTVQNENPFTIDNTVFNHRAYATLYVPAGSKSAYETADVWKEFREIVETTPSPAIAFADANVKALCVANWDTNDDGELSEAEAAAVASLGEVFKGNTAITSFDELEYFTGLKEIGANAFSGCNGLRSVVFPNRLETIGENSFLNTRLSTITIPASVKSIVGKPFNGGYYDDEGDYYASPSAYIVDKDNQYYSSFYTGVGAGYDRTLYNKDKTQLLDIPNGSSSSSAFPSTVKACFDDFYGDVSFGRGSVDVKAWIEADFSIHPDYVDSDFWGWVPDVVDVDESIIRFPSNLEKIGSRVFEGLDGSYCGIEEVTIPNGVTSIGDYAFKSARVKTVTIPSTVTVIGDYAFSSVYSLTVNVNATTPPAITATTFANCTNLTINVPEGSLEAYATADYWKEYVKLPEPPSPAIEFADANVKALCVANWDTNGDGELSEAEAAAVTDLGEVFKENRDITSFDELEYFTGLTDLGSAFETCTGLRSIVIPVNVVALDAVGNLASLESIRVVEGNTKYDSRNNCNAVIETETNKLVMGCQTTIIPEGITVIGQNAFGGRWGMSEINFPASLKTIEEAAFAYCISLNNIKLPSGLESIQEGGFGVFDNCGGLKEVIVEWAEPLSIPANTFEGCDLENATLYVPYGTKAAYEAADVWKDFGTIVEVPFVGTIFTAEVNGLQMQFRVTDADEKKVETYGTYEEGPAIDPETEGEVVIPAEVNGFTVTGIGGWSFRNCQGITSVSLPTTLTYIGESAFRTCYGLTEVVIPEGVTTIGSRAFYTGNLHKVTLPSTLQEIGGDYTFTLSQDSDNIVIVNNPEPIAIPVSAFQWESMKRSVLMVPFGSREAYQAADYWKEFGEIVEMAPETEPADIAEGTYLLKNVETGKYLYAGNAWNTHTVLDDIALPVTIGKQTDGSYTFTFPVGSFNQKLLFRADETDVYVDYNDQENGCPYWTVTTSDGGESYFIQSLTTHEQYGQETLPATYLGAPLWSLLFQAWDGCQQGASVATNPEPIDDSDFGLESNFGQWLVPFSTVYGHWAVYYLWYADLTGVPSITIEGTPGLKLRMLLNRQAPEAGAEDQHGGEFVELNGTLDENGRWTVDLTGFEYVHLNAIKTDGGSPEGLVKCIKASIPTAGLRDVNGDAARCDAVTWTLETLPATRSEAQVERLQLLIAEAQQLVIETTEAEAMLSSSSATYLETAEAIRSLQQQVIDRQNMPNNLYVDEAPSVLRGSKAELNISLRNAGAVSSTDFYLQLPAGMTIVNSAVSIAADRSDNHQVSALLNEEGGYYHIVCHSGNNSVFKENDGLLFSMTIACDESVAAGSYEGQMKNILMWDSSKVESSQPDFTFSIEVPEQQLGDVNADSRINVGDIMEVVDNIMRRPSDNFNFAAANLYYDKKINVFDLVRLINLVLRQPMTSNTLSMARRLGRMMSGEASDVVSALTIADFGINPGEQQAVDIELSNADHPYSLLEFELTLPEGVSLAKGQDGKWAVAPSSSRITSAHTITVEEIGQGQYKFLVYSTQNTAIEGSSGAIMTLMLTADADAPVGLQQGSITGQVLAEADEDGYEPADVSFSVNVGLLRGDANGDGRVSIADVVAVVDYVTTNGNPTGQFVASAADTDGVEGITIADAVAIVNMIIGE